MLKIVLHPHDVLPRVHPKPFCFVLLLENDEVAIKWHICNLLLLAQEKSNPHFHPEKKKNETPLVTTPKKSLQNSEQQELGTLAYSVVVYSTAAEI